jgi:hypothetical protein
MDIVRITTHPHDHSIVLLHVPHSCNDLMGRYEPAQLDTSLKAYLLHTDHLDSLQTFATYTGLYLIDERGQTPAQVHSGQLCDICAKPERICRTDAGNTGDLHDHDYIPTARADLQRALTTPSAEEAQWTTT